MIEIRVSCTPGEIRAAAIRNGVLVDYAVERPGAPDGVGDRLRGRVVAVVVGMAGSFVALPGGVEGFLPDSQGGAGTGVGDAVTVVVTRAAQGGKGPRLSARTPQEGPGGVALLAAGPGAVERLLALHPGSAVIADDACSGATIVLRAWDDRIEEEVQALAEPLILLPGGMQATVHPTPALVAIDIDMAGGTAERRPKVSAQREANRAALPALARAIRLRNLSGAILIDLAGMSVKARFGLQTDVSDALSGDPLRPRFLGFTAGGLIEMIRPRVYPPVHELLAGPHAAGLAALREMMRACVADPSMVPVLRAHPEVARALEADGMARADLARRTGRPLMLQSDPGMRTETWVMEVVPRGPLIRG